MSGAPGWPKDPAGKTDVQRELEQLRMFDHHQEEVREVREQWRHAMERTIDHSSRELESPRRDA